MENRTTGATDTTISTGVGTSHPQLLSYGPERMLLIWQSGSPVAAQIHDSGSGQMNIMFSE